MMSETSKAAEATKKATDQTAKSGQVAMEAVERTTKDAIGETGKVVQHGADRAKEAAQNVTESVAETAQVTASVSSDAANQGREVLLMGVRTAADMGTRVADINYGRGHHLLSTAVQAMDIYRDASERSAERVRALFSSYMTVGRGWQDLQHAWLEMVDHSIETAAHKPQDLFRCKNIVELAGVQRDLYVDAVNHAFESTSRLLDIAGRTAQDAVRPLRSAAN